MADVTMFRHKQNIVHYFRSLKEKLAMVSRATKIEDLNFAAAKLFDDMMPETLDTAHLRKSADDIRQ
jgi:plasmid maintenance system killer protein